MANGKWEAQPSSKIAISFSDYKAFGCPVCLTGETKASSPIQVPDASLAVCAHCQVAYVVVTDGITHSPLGVGDIHPGELAVTPHPKRVQTT